MDLTSITPTPQQLKALTHPVRVRMLGMLRIDGPATATTLAERLRLNTGATSYHLRQLATHGFVEEATELGNARDRWWRAAHQATITERETPRDEEAKETEDAYLQSVAVVLTEQLQRAIEERPLLSDEWRAATEFSDWIVKLTPVKAKKLLESLEQLMWSVEEDVDDADAVEFSVQLVAFPLPGRLGGERS